MINIRARYTERVSKSQEVILNQKIIGYLTSKLMINKNRLNLIITEVVTIKVCSQFSL